MCGSASIILEKEGVHYNEVHTQMIIEKENCIKKNHNKEWLTVIKKLNFYTFKDIFETTQIQIND